MNKSESKYFNTAVKMDLALIDLLKEKPFEYITISEICTKAGVNRSTFYLHYENIGDLLNEITRYLLDGFLSYFSVDEKAIAHKFDECELEDLIFICNKYLSPYLTYIKDNKEVFSTALKHHSTFGFDDVHKDMFEHVYNPILDRFNYPKENRKYAMAYYLNGLNAIITEWLKDDCEKSIEEITKIMKHCVFGIAEGYKD